MRCGAVARALPMPATGRSRTRRTSSRESSRSLPTSSAAARTRTRQPALVAPELALRLDSFVNVEAAMVTCSHLDQVLVDKPEQVAGCEDCLAIGGWWVHLRVCRSCGHLACCDSSPNRHASAHAREEEHPIVTSMEAGEDWAYGPVGGVAVGL